MKISSFRPSAPLRGVPVISPSPLDGLFTAVECDRILGLAAEAEYREAGLVRGRQNESIRIARIHWLDDEGEGAWIFARLIEAVREVNRDTFGFVLTEFAERAQIARYEADMGGHFDWHSDIGEGLLAQKRKLTLVVQLSAAEDYSGGSLELNPAGQVEAVTRTRGSAVLFPSFMLHRVTPVTSGVRHSLTTWVHGPAFT